MFNNPYNYPYIDPSYMNMGRMPIKQGLLSSLKSIKWSNILNTTQKTLNVINQAIPVYYQIKPIWSNVKNLGKLMSVFNEPDNEDTTNLKNKVEKEKTNSPTFFIN